MRTRLRQVVDAEQFGSSVSSEIDSRGARLTFVIQIDRAQVRKLDDTEFRNPFERAYIRVLDDSDSSRIRARDRSRSRSRSARALIRV